MNSKFHNIFFQNQNLATYVYYLITFQPIQPVLFFINFFRIPVSADKDFYVHIMNCTSETRNLRLVCSMMYQVQCTYYLLIIMHNYKRKMPYANLQKFQHNSLATRWRSTNWSQKCDKPREIKRDNNNNHSFHHHCARVAGCNSLAKN